MPKAKSLINSILILFILFSIPVTVLVAQRSANLGSKAATADFSLQVSPGIQSVARGGHATYNLEMTFPDADIQSSTPVLLHFSALPEGVALIGQPIGAALSNKFQKTHLFQVAIDPKAAKGTYKVQVTASDLRNSATAEFSVVIQ